MFTMVDAKGRVSRQSSPNGASIISVLCLLFCLLSLSACVTPAEERQIRNDISGLQARMLEMENAMSETGRSISNRSNQHAASTNTRLDKIERDLQRIKGDIDALRVGVITGQMPGISSENEGSVAQSLELMRERLQTLEDEQKRVLEAIDQANKSSKKKAKRQAQNKVNNLKDMRRAFRDKRYAHVVESGSQVVRKQKQDADKQEALYILAESLYKMGRLRDAALRFNEYLEAKPSKHLAHAKMRMGDCFRHMGDKETAKIYYEELLSKHKGSDEAEKAKDRLAKL